MAASESANPERVIYNYRSSTASPMLENQKAIDIGRAMEAAKKELHSRPSVQESANDPGIDEPASISSVESASGVSVNAVSKHRQAKGTRTTPVQSRLCGTSRWSPNIMPRIQVNMQQLWKSILSATSPSLATLTTRNSLTRPIVSVYQALGKWVQ